MPSSTTLSRRQTTDEEAESLHAERLVACGRRIITVLSDPANHTAIRSEMALMASYFAAGHDEGMSNDNAIHSVNLRHPEPVQLPQLNRHCSQPQRHRPWDRESVPPFSSITAALLLGIAFDPLRSFDAQTRPEPLAAVYRDTDIEWGMVVLDVTDLIRMSGVVRYGIVGFQVGMGMFIASRHTNIDPCNPTGFGYPLRVLEEVRPRRAMSSVDYLTKFDSGGGGVRFPGLHAGSQ
ncbi:hypothetical protein PG994_002379 [Apiospora phragmitis]|uniref:Uncharacterized protein n=1 Tax=Apiospora phragmitis TaxID=2905665 RepID=A0ABR1WW93_9PEZI